MLCIPFSLYLTDYQGLVPVYTQEINPQVNSSSDAHDACFIFGHVVGTVKEKYGSKGCMETLGRDNYGTEFVAKYIRSSVENHSPSGS